MRGTFLILGHILGILFSFAIFCVFVAFSTKNVVEQREIPKTNLAGVKPFEKIDSRPFSG